MLRGSADGNAGGRCFGLGSSYRRRCASVCTWAERYLRVLGPAPQVSVRAFFLGWKGVFCTSDSYDQFPLHDLDFPGQNRPLACRIQVMVVGGNPCNLHDLGNRLWGSPGLELYYTYTDPAQHLRTAGWGLDDLYDVYDL